MEKFKAWFDEFLKSGRGWWLIAVAFVLLIGFMSSAAAAVTYSAKDESGNVIRLFNEPCSHADLKALAREELRHLAKLAEFHYKGRVLRACWIATQGVVHVIDEDKDYTRVPMHVFQKDVDA